MKLLILTQKVDTNDPILGFFHRWIEEFAKHCEKVTVICLQKGEYNLPDNVKVLSLGKENGQSRLKYIFNFYKYIWQERKNYDSVFVHMNQEYVLLGGLFWRIMKKKISMWRNHYAGNFLTSLAVAISNNIFCTSRYSFTAKSKKAKIMPVGIDTECFTKTSVSGEDRAKDSVLFIGRISPTKKPDLIIDALEILQKEGLNFTSNFYGNPEPKDFDYLNSLKSMVKNSGMDKKVNFKNGVPNKKTPQIYNNHQIFVNASPDGMYDKTIFEAMACGTLVITSNLNLKNEIDKELFFTQNDKQNLANHIKKILSLTDKQKEELGKKLRNYVEKKHSLKKLILQILE